MIILINYIAYSTLLSMLVFHTSKRLKANSLVSHKIAVVAICFTPILNFYIVIKGLIKGFTEAKENYFSNKKKHFLDN